MAIRFRDILPRRLSVAMMVLTCLTSTIQARTFECDKLIHRRAGELFAAGPTNLKIEAQSIDEARSKAATEFQGEAICHIQQNAEEVRKRKEAEAAWREAPYPSTDRSQSAAVAAPIDLGPRESPFRRLTFGDYFDAIYNGDVDRVRSIDQKYLGNARMQMQTLKNDPLWGKMLASIDLNHVTLMVPLMRAYLQNYGQQYAKCLRADAVTITIRTTVTNGYGARQGQTDDAYRVNREFAQAFEASASLGPQNGLGDLADMANGGAVDRIESGTLQLMASLVCNDPRVKRFETALLALYERVANGR